MSAEDQRIRSTVRQFITSEFLQDEDPASLKDDTPLITAGIMDSIGTVRLVTHLEQEFGITLEQRDITVQHFDNVRTITELVRSKLTTSRIVSET